MTGRLHDDLDSLTIGRLNVDLNEDVVPLLALVGGVLPLFDMVELDDPDELDVSEAGESSSR